MKKSLSTRQRWKNKKIGKIWIRETEKEPSAHTTNTNTHRQPNQSQWNMNYYHTNTCARTNMTNVKTKRDREKNNIYARFYTHEIFWQMNYFACAISWARLSCILTWVWCVLNSHTYSSYTFSELAWEYCHFWIQTSNNTVLRSKWI